MNNISFQGKSFLSLNTSKYNEIAEKTRKSYSHLTDSKNCLLRNNHYFTASVDSENVLVMVKGHDTGFFKFLKTVGQNSKIIDEIALKTQDLISSSKNTLSAWIIGGDKISGKNGNKTIEIINELGEILCDKHNIDTSIMVGLKKPQENIIVYDNKDGLYITLEKMKNIDLQNEFDIFELNNTNII